MDLIITLKPKPYFSIHSKTFLTYGSCDSRGKCYQMNHQFEDIEIKSNVIELLKLLLKKKRKKL